MDTQRLAQLLREGADDYSQLLDGYPNAKKFMDALGDNISRHVPTREEFKDPKAMQEYGLSVFENQLNPIGNQILKRDYINPYIESLHNQVGK